MSARLIIESVGPGATIQDAGRHGLLRFGVTPAGPMDWAAFRSANRALGNPIGAAAIEIAAGGISLGAETPLVVAFAGGGFIWTIGHEILPSAARVLLRPGESLRARAGPWGAFAYCAVPNGIDVAPILGSRATHTRSSLGGIDGRALRGGDTFVVSAGSLLDDKTIDAPWLRRAGEPIRIILGPQADHFSDETIAAFLAGTYKMTAQADRMAYKLQGPSLAHKRDFNIVSDGVALGAIQIAGDGQPMVLMADRQPTGGYPKIAHVCRVDIGRLAQLRPCETCRFRAITPDEARAALFELEGQLDGLDSRLLPLRLTPDGRRLSTENLISGIIG